ncbi:T9SS sorting signal type C domain-containing protein [Flavobacterium hydrophilum]|uniref:Ig-like domain-containing protein n=1 Tax=Flavobacterium hydrophilum TaxID=2211445 RepID=A0A2V4C117_9FLAO|nr:T9SS sorting signal type C domain-containing protein [Flavobacterium hydrophilum]PXY44562.1 hypothetical protein DMB68_13935 [Flavobacterium hydrophilum]
MKKTLLKSRVLATVLFFTVFLFGNTVFGQTTGDYRSVGTGNWTTPASWEYYNGTVWVAATSYPGQNAGTGTVTIRNSHVITLNNSITNSFTSLVIGSGTSGELVINNDISINTTSVSIMSNGTMSFTSNKSVTFPANTSFLVSSGGKLYATNSNCSNQTALYIGTTKVSACTGNGGGALTNFDTFNSSGGTGSATSNTPVCTGNQLVLTAIPPTATSGGPYTYTYRWSGNGISSPSYSSSATYTINSANVNNHGGVYTVDIRRNDGFISTVSTNVVVNPTPVGGGVYSGNTPICFNASTGNMTLGGGYVGTIVRWEKRLNSGSWTSISNTSAVYSENPSVAGTWEYRAVVGSGACPVVYSTPFTVVVNPELTITLVSTNANGCQNNSNTTFSYTATTGNANRVYIDFDSAATAAGIQQHQDFGVSSGSGTITIQYTWGTAPGVYNGVMTVVKDNPFCKSSTTYPVTVTINPAGTAPSISSQPVAPPAVCSGSGTQTISVAATGAGLTYQWRRNSTPLTNGGVISGATTSTLTLTNPTTANAGTYDVVITGTCSSGVTSNQVTVTVNANLSAVAVTPNTAQNVCITGSGSALTASPTGGGTITYQWGKRSVSGGAITAIGGQTSASYTPTGAGLTGGTWYVVCTATPTCGSAVISNEVTVIVNPALSAAPITPNTAQNICVSASGTALTVTPTGGGTVTYQWGKRSVSGGAITAIGGQTASSYTPTGASLTAGTWLVVCTSTPSCGSAIISNEVSVTVTANLSAVAVTPSAVQNICLSGSGTALTASPTGGGTTTYQWGKRSVSGGAITAIGGQTSASYTPTGAGLTGGTWYVVCTATPTCGSAVISNEVTVIVNPALSAAPITPNTAQNICVSASGTALTVTPTGGGTVTYQWGKRSVSGGAITAIGGQTASSYTPTGASLTAGTWLVICTSTPSCGSPIISNEVTVTVNTAPVTPGAILQPVNLCAGSTGNIYSIASVNGATSYNWSVTGVGWSVTAGGTTTSATITVGSGVGTVSVTATNTCGTSSASTTGNITPNPRPTPTFTTLAQAQTCADQHMTYTTQQGQSNYVWTVSGVPDTDYRLIARGTSTNHDIVIEWLTGGSKTVTVNYNNSNGCNAVSPATYTTNVVVVDKGQVNGGREDLCKVDALPTLTLHSIAGNTIAYPDPSLILKWQYSDNADNSNWQDILGTTGVVSYTPTAFPGAFRTYQVVLQSPNGCTKTSIESRIRIVAFAPPSSGTIVSTNCAGSTGSVVLNGLPTGNWTLYRTGTSSATITGTGSSTTISNLAAGTYNFTYKEGNCTSDPLVVNITRLANIWDGTKWSKTNNTTLPTSDDAIVFEGNYTVTSDITACSCTVNSGNVIVNSGRTLTITNEVTVTGGTLTFENNASLLQDVNTTVNNNSGPITYKRTSQLMKLYDFTYWSSPVENQTLYNLSPNTRWDKYLSYTGDVWKEELSSSAMQPGIGYIIRVPEPNKVYPNGKDTWSGQYAQQLEFTGRPNNGNITSSQYMEKDKYYLIGNPYPSAMHADDFLFVNVNNRGILGGTIYFWTHNTAIKKVGSNYAYVSDDYAAYNLTGGVGTSAKSDSGYNDNPALDTGIKPTGYIAAGQSFFASAEDGSGHVQFTNSMRYGGTNNSQFFKPGKTSKPGVLEKHRLWLNMTNSGGAFKQTLIGYVEGATNSYDKSFDGLTFDGNSYADFYSVNEASNMTIQGRALPFADTDVVPLGYRSNIAGNFTIAIDQADGNLASQRIYLEDKQTGTINELTAKNYTFTTKAGTFNNRFVLRYTNKTLGTGDFETVDDAVWVLAQNKTVTVNSTTENIDKVFIYDLSGKQLYKKEEVKNLQLMIQHLPFEQQVLLVKVVLDNGYETTKKVIFK